MGIPWGRLLSELLYASYGVSKRSRNGLPLSGLPKFCERRTTQVLSGVVATCLWSSWILTALHEDQFGQPWLQLPTSEAWDLGAQPNVEWAGHRALDTTTCVSRAFRIIGVYLAAAGWLLWSQAFLICRVGLSSEPRIQTCKLGSNHTRAFEPRRSLLESNESVTERFWITPSGALYIRISHCRENFLILRGLAVICFRQSCPTLEPTLPDPSG